MAQTKFVTKRFCMEFGSCEIKQNNILKFNHHGHVTVTQNHLANLDYLSIFAAYFKLKYV
jgi:hypothetical protein